MKRQGYMKQYIILYKGPATSPDASHAGWPEWFSEAGHALVDRGSALVNGLTVLPEGDPVSSTLGVNGYSIVQAENVEELQSLIREHPYLKQGAGYSIEIFEQPR